MRIAYICDEYPPRPHGGIGTFVYSIAHAMKAEGHNVTVVGFGQQLKEHDDCGVKVVSIPLSSIWPISGLISRLRLHNWLAKAAYAGHIDLVEVPEYSGLLPFRFKACPVVVRLHLSHKVIAVDAGVPPSRTTAWCEKRTLNSHGNWIGVSGFILERTKNLFNSNPLRAKVVYNPAPVGNNANKANVQRIKSEYGDYILYVGTISERKGALVLASAARVLLAEFPNLKLVYLGKETLINELPISGVICKTIGPTLSSRVVFPGRKSHAEVFEWMSGAKIVVSPSKLESFGLVALESMFCGVPVVYTKAGPGPEVVDDNETGLLVDPNSAVDVADKITRLLKDDLLAARLIQNAKERIAQKFSMKKCVDSTLAFYVECVAGKK